MRAPGLVVKKAAWEGRCNDGTKRLGRIHKNKQLLTWQKVKQLLDK